MAATIAEAPIKKIYKDPKLKQQKKITWEDFQKRFLSREDEYSYEWVNGYVEKTKRTMNYKQMFIVKNLMNLFMKLYASGKVTGLLSNEVDTFFLLNHRRPDLCYLTDKQMYEIDETVAPIPQFVIEIISNNDKIKSSEEKMMDYRRAGVPIIWQVFPDLQVVHIYKGTKMQIYSEDEICSAAPVLPDFNISVNDIFSKTPKQ